MDGQGTRRGIEEDAVIQIEGIEITGFHGVREEERQVGNRFKVNLEISANIEPCIESDALEDTIDFAQAVKAVRDISEASTYHLIESFAASIGDCLLSRFPRIDKLSVLVAKLNPPGVGGEVETVAVRINRERE